LSIVAIMSSVVIVAVRAWARRSGSSRRASASRTSRSSGVSVAGSAATSTGVVGCAKKYS
jgi:hypothetical protein